MSKLSYVNIFRPAEYSKLERFLQRVFGFPGSGSHSLAIFRGLDAAPAASASTQPDAYELLHLSEHADNQRCKFLLNYWIVDSPQEGRRMVAQLPVKAWREP